MEWSRDVSAAEWIIRRLHPSSASDVCSLVPEGFDSYARILHPVPCLEDSALSLRSWQDLARQAGLSLYPTTQFEALQASAARRNCQPPDVGTLDRDTLDAVIEILAPATAQPQACWFGIWEGYGWMQGPPAIAALVRAPPRRDRPSGKRNPPGYPLVNVAGRNLVLYRGPVTEAAAFSSPPASQSPNLWWPADHAWCVASDIDLPSTYVGASEPLIGQVLDDSRIEALPTSAADPITAD
jgi:hypothetical protein